MVTDKVQQWSYYSSSPAPTWQLKCVRAPPLRKPQRRPEMWTQIVERLTNGTVKMRSCTLPPQSHTRSGRLWTDKRRLIHIDGLEFLPCAGLTAYKSRMTVVPRAHFRKPSTLCLLLCESRGNIVLCRPHSAYIQNHLASSPGSLLPPEAYFRWEATNTD